jgi:hypothetical protein
MPAERLTERRLDAISAVSPAPRSTVWHGPSLMALRAIVSLHALAILAQGITAGRYLAGYSGAVLGHQLGARVVVLLCLVQVLIAALFWRRGGGPAWLTFSSAGMVVAEVVQFGTGVGQAWALHIPLGVLLFGGAMRLLAWVVWMAPLASAPPPLVQGREA